MFIFQMVRRLVLIICIVLGAIYVYDTYQSYQGTNRVSKAHTTVEQTIEENEDTLSRWERMHRIFTFRFQNTAYFFHCQKKERPQLR